MKTKVISARVPLDVAEMFETACKQRSLTKSTYLKQIITSPELPSTIMANGGAVIAPNNMNIPEELEGILAGVGGVGAGILTYKTLKTFLPSDKLTPEQIDGWSTLGAIAVGLGSAWGLMKMMEGK